MCPWQYRAFGTAADPVRQSALDSFTSQANGCARRYRFDRDAEADGEKARPQSVSWRPTLGTACHEVIRRAFNAATPAILAGKLPSRERVLAALDEELARSAYNDIEGHKMPDGFMVPGGHGYATRIIWGDANPRTEKSAAVSMVLGALSTTAERAVEVLAVEAPFSAELDGFHLSGTIDLAYRPREAPESVALADWKTGARHAPRAILDYGPQVSMYAHALERGVLWPGTERETRIGQYPATIHIVHLRDFVSHDRAVAMLALLRVRGAMTSAEVADALPHYQMTSQTVASVFKPLAAQGLIVVGKRKQSTLWEASGSHAQPSTKELWYRSQRGPEDVARFRVSLRTIVGTVRMGRFVESLGEQCDRCPHRAQCLGAGHELTNAEQRQVADALEGIDLDGLDASAGEAA